MPSSLPKEILGQSPQQYCLDNYSICEKRKLNYLEITSHNDPHIIARTIICCLRMCVCVCVCVCRHKKAGTMIRKVYEMAYISLSLLQISFAQASF